MGNLKRRNNIGKTELAVERCELNRSGSGRSQLADICKLDIKSWGSIMEGWRGDENEPFDAYVIALI